MLKDRKIINKIIEINNIELLQFLYEFLDSTNNDYIQSSMRGIPYLVSIDRNTRMSICRTAYIDDISCRIESKNGSYLSFKTKMSNNSIYDLHSKILANNNLYIIKFCESEQKRYIKIYKNVDIIEVDLYKPLSGEYTTVSLDKVFELDDNSNNIGLTLDNASSIGCFWCSPDSFIDEITRQNIKSIGKR